MSCDYPLIWESGGLWIKFRVEHWWSAFQLSSYAGKWWFVDKILGRVLVGCLAIILLCEEMVVCG